MGKTWFQNEHQAPEQWGLYYIDGKFYYPRFDRDITYYEAERYLYGWIKRLIVINPYTRFKTKNDNRLVESIVKQLEENPDEHDLKTIIHNIIGSNEPFVINEIIANALNNYSEVVKVQTINKDNEQFIVSLLPNYKEIIKTKYNMTKKEYFDLFNDIVVTKFQKESRQQIFYGAPGTGKSHTINEITKAQPEDNVVRTTFHPDSDYSTFVGAYKPTTKEVAMRDVTGKIIIENGKEVTEDRIVYEFVEQAFLQAYIRAWKLYASTTSDTEVQPQYLIIEEINRGNCAQIFGDLFQLLDRGDSGFSEYPIKADNDMQKQLAKAFSNITFSNPDSINQLFDGKDIAPKVLSGEVLLLPKNLYIWATMNTSDQSLFPIDSAFKRRWDWKYVPIADAKKNWTIVANGNQYDWWQFLDKINTEIEKATHSEDKKLGYFFCKAKNGIVDAETFVGKVVFYLWNDVFKDFVDESGDLFKDDEGRLTFDKFYTIDTDGNTKVVDVKIVRFLQNLGVEPVNGDNNDEEENDDADGKNQRKETLLSIQIPNHPKMASSDSTQFDVFVDALKIIGIDKILPIVDNLKYERLNRPVLSKVKYPEIENNDKGYSYYQADGLYIIKGCKSYTYIRILEDLNEALNVGLTLETK
jgi:MoxR-like ATPase